MAVCACVTCFGAASLPPGLRLSLTDRALTTHSHDAVVSTALLCNDRTFEALGMRAPRLSPDEHWILVGVLGPYAPGNVVRNYALVQVRTGRVALAPDFPTLLGIPSPAGALSWASGERETLRYADEKTAALHDPPARPLPPERCAGEQSAAFHRRTGPVAAGAREPLSAT